MGVVAVGSLLAACTSGGSAAPSASSSPAVAQLGLSGVKTALAATRAANSARFDSRLAFSFDGGSVVNRQVGTFDVRAARAETTLSFTADPPALGRAMGIDPATDMTMRILTTPTATYQKMPAWPASVRGRWLKLDAAAYAEIGVTPDFAHVLPRLLAILDSATESKSTKGAGPRVAHVTVTSADLLGALPASSTHRLLEAGLDIAELTADVDVIVRVDGAGRVAHVRVDALDTLRDAYSRVGKGGELDDVEAIVAEITLSEHGLPVRITSPADTDTMTGDEFERLAG